MPAQRSSSHGLRVRVVVLGAVLSAAGAAQADVGPAPQCPAGLDGLYHAGHYCAPRACATDAECEAGAKCLEQSLCLTVRDASDPDHPRYEHAGSCAAGATCEQGAACVTKRFCAAAPEPAPTPGPGPTPAPRHGCGCELPAAASSSAAGAALLALALAGALGRRRRR